MRATILYAALHTHRGVVRLGVGEQKQHISADVAYGVWSYGSRTCESSADYRCLEDFARQRSSGSATVRDTRAFHLRLQIAYSSGAGQAGSMERERDVGAGQVDDESATFKQAARRSQAVWQELPRSPDRCRVVTGERPTGPLHIGHPPRRGLHPAETLMAKQRTSGTRCHRPKRHFQTPANERTCVTASRRHSRSSRRPSEPPFGSDRPSARRAGARSVPRTAGAREQASGRYCGTRMPPSRHPRYDSHRLKSDVRRG